MAESGLLGPIKDEFFFDLGTPEGDTIKRYFLAIYRCLATASDPSLYLEQLLQACEVAVPTLMFRKALWRGINNGFWRVKDPTTYELGSDHEERMKEVKLKHPDIQ